MASPDVLKYRTQAFPPLFSLGKEERKLGSALLNLGEGKKKVVTGMLGIPKLLVHKYEGKGTKLLVLYLVFLTRLRPPL